MNSELYKLGIETAHRANRAFNRWQDAENTYHEHKLKAPEDRSSTHRIESVAFAGNAEDSRRYFNELALIAGNIIEVSFTSDQK